MLCFVHFNLIAVGHKGPLTALNNSSSSLELTPIKYLEIIIMLPLVIV